MRKILAFGLENQLILLTERLARLINPVAGRTHTMTKRAEAWKICTVGWKPPIFLSLNVRFDSSSNVSTAPAETEPESPIRFLPPEWIRRAHQWLSVQLDPDPESDPVKPAPAIGPKEVFLSEKKLRVIWAPRESRILATGTNLQWSSKNFVTHQTVVFRVRLSTS